MHNSFEMPFVLPFLQYCISHCHFIYELPFITLEQHQSHLTIATLIDIQVKISQILTQPTVCTIFPSFYAFCFVLRHLSFYLPISALVNDHIYPSFQAKLSSNCQLIHYLTTHCRLLALPHIATQFSQSTCCVLQLIHYNISPHPHS